MAERRQDWSPKALYVIATKSRGLKFWLRDIEGSPPGPMWTRRKTAAGTFRSRREAAHWAKSVGMMMGGARAWVEMVR